MKVARILRAFTVIELLVVVAIIAILASLTLSTAGYIQRKGALARAETELAAISSALENFKADNGDYPIYNRANSSSPAPITLANLELMTNLCPPPNSTNKIYYFAPKSGTSASGLIDPFGELYGYFYNGTNTNNAKNPGFFDLWSRAGSANTNQWIKNW